MKKVLFILLFASIFSLKATPYIIPDVGAPGMAVYVELIADHNFNNYFGAEGLYLNRPGDPVYIRISSGENLVEFGPLLVSWSGRMLSTVIFVKPNANPLSTEIDPNFRVTFEVINNGNNTAAFNFHVVRPYNLGNNGDISGLAETVFGEGNLGKRSPRGAMVVDSLILDGRTFSVSTEDCDPNTPGNQGYLPFVLLSKGPIRGNGSTITANGSGKNGGPGGGGGGGSFHDYLVIISTGTGSNGGDGFVGGGAGGRNRNGQSVSDIYRDPGEGTGGINGTSLNGVPASQPVSAWESSAGGTGHPFGSSGQHSSSGTNDNTTGGFGGGSGSLNNRPGGSGSYATLGFSEGTIDGGNGGKIHGNSMGVPIAGGSGAAGGNPNTPFNVSGEGGGGGGAIRVFAQELEDLTITANGGNGSNGSGSSDGGSGSGGFANLMSKLTMNNVALETRPGVRNNRFGGAGRVRLDGNYGNNFSNYLPNDASFYRGISTDTTRFVKKEFMLRGTADVGKRVDIYIKPNNQNWRLYRGDIDIAFPNWQSVIDLESFPCDTFFLLAIQKSLDPPVVSTMAYVPQLVMSQAAANILVPAGPELLYPQDTVIRITACRNEPILDSIKISNIGCPDLTLQLRDTWIIGDDGLSIPFEANLTIEPEEEAYLVFELNPNGTGIYNDTLILVSNDPNSPILIPITIDYELIEYELSLFNETQTNLIDTLWLDSICAGEVTSKSFVLQNISSFDIDSLYFGFEGQTNSDNYLVIKENEDFIPSNGVISIEVTYQDDEANVYNGGVGIKLFIYASNCPEDPIDSLEVWIKTFNVNLVFEPSLVDFGDIAVNSIGNETVILKNFGSESILITNPPNIPVPFDLINSTPNLPFLLEPQSVNPNSEIEFNLSVTWDREELLSDSLEYFVDKSGLNNLCDGLDSLYLLANFLIWDVDFPADTVDFGIRYECLVDTTLDIFIRNNVDFTITLQNQPLEGLNTDNFEIVAVPNTILPGGSNNYRVNFIPTKDPEEPGMYYGQFNVNVTNIDGLEETIFLKGEVDVFDINFDLEPLDYGDIPTNIPQQIILNITNNGKLPREVSNIIIPNEMNADRTNFIISGNGAQEQIVFTILLDENMEGNYSDQIIFEFEPCDREMQLEVRANGVKGILEISPSTNIGIVTPCFNQDITYNLSNTGTFELTIDSIYANNSKLATPNDELLIVGGQVQFQINIDAAGNLGIQQFPVIIYYTENGIEKELSLFVSIDARTGIILNPKILGFGQVPVTIRREELVNIIKDPETNWNVDAIIDDNNRLAMVPEYSVLDNDNYSINQLEEAEFRVEFTPTNFIFYSDELLIPLTIDGNCSYIDTLYMRGQGISGGRVFVRIPEFIAEPNIDEFEIPIYASSFDTSRYDGLSIANITLKLNKTLFYPTNAIDISGNNAIINSIFADGNSDDLLISISSDEEFDLNSNEQIIMTIKGATLLGNSRITELSLESIDFLPQGRISVIDTINGLLDLQICEADGGRLINYIEPISIDISQNIAQDRVTITLNLIERGLHSLYLSDFSGNTILLQNYERIEINSKNQFVFNLDINDYSTGMYYLILKTPARVKTIPLTIMK